MKTTLSPFFLSILLGGIMLLGGCSKDKNGDRLLFTVQDDIAMGQQSAAQVDSIYAGRILSPAQHPQAYAYVNNVRDQILNSGQIAYKDEFTWDVKLINDTTLNAFCTPGGHIYFYTGLIKYLDSPDHFAGVMGHEMAHADKRHTSRQLQRQYGISVLLGIITGGNPGTLAQIAASLATLDYSREHETEADAASVDYLGAPGVPYACNGAAGFFQKLLDAGQGSGGPVFLSTHPAAADRVNEINAKATSVGCDTSPTPTAEYEAFKNSLP